VKRAVRLLRRARQDLEEIDAYISREAPLRVERFMVTLLDAIESLATMPDRGASPRDEVLRGRGYRVLLHEPYPVFYKVLRRQVRVYRVLHGRRAYRELV
jgi:plasmid stabilization system protein ParE